jgi:hypothetical protein
MPYIFTPQIPYDMDSKVTLSFDEEVIRRAKEYAASQNISLSRLVEFLLRKTTMSEYRSMEDFPIADWVREVAEGPAEYKTAKRSRKSLKNEFFTSRKKK